jgi:hypothetical protein
MNPDEELERVSLESLAPAIAPPRELEDRVVGALSERGLLRAGKSRGVFLAAAAAAVLAAFAAGMAVGRREPPAAPATASNRFVLFLEPLPEEVRGDSSHEPARVAEYRAWARKVHESGRAITGEKLRGGARVIGPDRAKLAEVSPAGSVAGYFVISARDYEDALSIARDCPRTRHGGTIVVRAIDPT